jgi:ParB-like nuclease domain
MPIQHIPCSNLVYPAWYRVYFPLDRPVEELAEELLRKGFSDSNPVEVRRISNEKFEIVDGVRRVVAAERIGMTAVPCVISNISEDEAKRKCLEKNLGVGTSSADLSLGHAVILYDEYRKLKGANLSARDLLKKSKRKFFTLKRALTCVNFAIAEGRERVVDPGAIKGLSIVETVARLLELEVWPPLSELFDPDIPVSRWMKTHYEKSTLAESRKMGPRKNGRSRDIFSKAIAMLVEKRQPVDETNFERAVAKLSATDKEKLVEQLKWMLNQLVESSKEKSETVEIPKTIKSGRGKRREPSSISPSLFDGLGEMNPDD